MVGGAKAWKPALEEHLIVLATAASPETAAEVAVALARLTQATSPTIVMVALIGVEEWTARREALASLRQALQRGGVLPTARLHLNAAEWGRQRS